MRNYKRVIETWFDDEYKEYFYTREPLARLVDMGDISEQLKMKEEKNCKSFDWFMKEIAYDVFDKYPRLPPNRFWGELSNTGSTSCLDTYGRHPPGKMGVSGCHGFGGAQMFRLNTEGQLSSGEWCVAGDRADNINISWCPQGSNAGPWEYSEDTHHMVNTRTGKCLSLIHI